MKIHITSTGSPNVGIAGQEATVDWGDEHWPPAGTEDRLDVRATLHEAFASIFGEPFSAVRVRFDDECDGCGHTLCRCPPEE